MTRLFISLYLGLLTTLFAFVFVAHLINTYLIIDIDNILYAENFSAELALLEELEGKVPQKQLDEFIQMIGDRNQVVIKEIELNQVPVNVQKQLVDKTVWFDDEEYNYFRIFSPIRYFQIVDDEQSELLEIAAEIELVILLTLLSSVALCCFIWFFRLHRKLRLIENTLESLASGNLAARVPTTSSTKVGTLNIRLNQMAEQVQHLLESHKRLSHTVAHEFRSPLFRMQMQLDLLEDASDSEKALYIKGLDEDIFSLQDLVDELLDYAKMERAELKLNPEPVDIQNLVESLTEKLSLECSNDIDFVNRLDKELLIEVDRKLLERCLINLLRNAYKYGDSKIRCTIELTNQHVVVDIEDNGPGIAKDEREHIFKPFYRLKGNGQVTGYGLGLAIVKEIIRLHGGAIDVDESNLGGALFRVQLPVKNMNLQSE